MIRMATGHTLKFALCLSVLLAHMTTDITGLRRVLRIYCDYFAICFLLKLLRNLGEDSGFMARQR